ncbi:MAG TPA: FxSxx-COOH system tetratricopeptide repeat protein [Streptosporangiaceae bacterium]|nr:FxSxx-COOH system tetratricopeptide repeat protein [Streptosporangiaceae bacterium]
MVETGDEGRPQRRLAVWGREIPFRNRHFTGREEELAELHRRLTEDSTVLLDQPPLPIHGMGGVGKTEIAAEYAHRHRDQYDLIWWVRAEQDETIINSLIALGRKMRLPHFRTDDRDTGTEIVLEALVNQDPYERWLLIFDDAQSATVVSKYIPEGGHVILTSRDQHWRRALRVEGIEIGEFKPEETTVFLRKRVPVLAEVAMDDRPDAARENERRDAAAAELAAELGHLPLAAEHAAAYLVETGTSVEEYVRLFRRNAHELFASEVNINYPQTVTTTWSVSLARISREADALFKLLAFLSAEPISEHLLVQPTATANLPVPLNRVLAGRTEFRRAARELGRFSLLKVSGTRNVVQLHRVVRAVTKDRLAREDPDAAERFRDAAHLLLAASDPGTPHRDDSEPIYQLSLQHIVPSDAHNSANPPVRRLIINQVERLYVHGGTKESLGFGEPILRHWRNRFGADDKQTLALAVQIGAAMRTGGQWEEAWKLHSDTLARLKGTVAEIDPVYLTCARVYGIDLRLLGRYGDALENDLALLPVYEREFGLDHPDTLRVRNNIGVSLRCLGRFDDALRYDEETLAERLRTLAPNEHGTLSSMFGKSRDLRGLGHYEESLDLIREINETLESKGGPWHLFRLLVVIDFSVALRYAGYYNEAFTQGAANLERHRSILGPDHRQTLQAATNLINDHRVNEDLTGAHRLGEQTLAAWEKIAGPDHPNTLSTCSNLATALRMRGNPKRARELNERALTGFCELFGDEHPSTLVTMHNLASDLAMLGEVKLARQMGERALEISRSYRRPQHPSTLATMANLALDRRADGDVEGADLLREEALAGYRASELPDHPHARLAQNQGRLNLNLEPMHD